ncbi:MAG: hypothetical protein GY822_16900 [Deltaproteobacteria bacterium]|nr:hypothetical protein [Deltaproteobacteria bacterium]
MRYRKFILERGFDVRLDDVITVNSIFDAEGVKLQMGVRWPAFSNPQNRVALGAASEVSVVRQALSNCSESSWELWRIL